MLSMVQENIINASPATDAATVSAQQPAAIGFDSNASCNFNLDTSSEQNANTDLSYLVSTILAPDNKRLLKEYLGMGDDKVKVDLISDEEAAEHFETANSMRKCKNKLQQQDFVEEGPFFRVTIGVAVFYWSISTLLSLKAFTLISDLLEVNQRSRQFDPADAFSAAMTTVSKRHRNNVSITINEVFQNSAKLTKLRAFCERINNEVFETCIKLYSSILIQAVYILSHESLRHKVVEDDEMQMLLKRLEGTPFKDIILFDGFVSNVPASAAQLTHVKGAGSKIKEGHRTGDRRENLATKNCHLKGHLGVSAITRAIAYITVTEGVDAEHRHFLPQDLKESDYAKNSLFVADRGCCALKVIKKAKLDNISILVRGRNDLAYKILEIKDKHGNVIPLPDSTYRADGEIKPVSLNDKSMTELVNKYGQLDCIVHASAYIEVCRATEEELALCAPATKPNQKQRKLDCGRVRVVMNRGLEKPFPALTEKAALAVNPDCLPCERNDDAPANVAGELVLNSMYEVETKSDESQRLVITHDPSNKASKSKDAKAAQAAEPIQFDFSAAETGSYITVPSNQLSLSCSPVIECKETHSGCHGLIISQDARVAYEPPMILITNVSADILSADDITTFYQYRWGIELDIKSLRQGNSLQATHARRISFALEMLYCSLISYTIKTFFALNCGVTHSSNCSPELCQHIADYALSSKLGISRYHNDVSRAVHTMYNNYNGIDAATTCNLDVLSGAGEFKPSLRSERYDELPAHIDFHRDGDLCQNVTLLNGKLSDAKDAVNEAIINPDNTVNMQMVEELEECFKASGAKVDFKKAFDKIRKGAADAGICVSNAIIRPKNLDSISLLKLHNHPFLSKMMASLFVYGSSRQHCSTNAMQGYRQGPSYYEVFDEVDKIIKNECKEGHISIRTWQQANDMRILAARNIVHNSA